MTTNKADIIKILKDLNYYGVDAFPDIKELDALLDDSQPMTPTAMMSDFFINQIVEKLQDAPPVLYKLTSLYAFIAMEFASKTPLSRSKIYKDKFIEYSLECFKEAKIYNKEIREYLDDRA